MKPLLALFVLFAAFTVNAQTETPVNYTLQSQIARGMLRQPSVEGPFVLREQRPNEIIINGTTYSGIFVQLGKGQDPLQLLPVEHR